MNRKIMSQIMLMLLIITLISLTLNIGTVLAQETIYIRSDGSVDPATAPISHSGNVYTFTANIYESIVIERDNIIVNGNNYLLQGSPPSIRL